MQLYEHQRRLIERDPKNLLLCWDTGTGKSLAAVKWSKIEHGNTALFVVPKALKEKWKRDVAGGQNAYVLTKEEFKKLHKALSRYDCIIVDEAHYFAGPKSDMSKSLYAYIKAHKPRVLLLTATPYLSTPWNIYTLARHLGHNWHYIDFQQKFFTPAYFGRRMVMQPRKGIEPEIAELVQRIGDVVRLDECIDVPEQVFEVEQFALTEAQKKAVENNFEINPIVRFTKNHEIENGFLYKEFNPTELYECDKVDRIVELCDQHKKIAVVCRYNEQINVLLAHLKKQNRMQPIYVIRGDVKDRDKIVREVEASDQAVVLINASCSEGYELPSIGVIVFASLSFSYKDYKQMCGRFLRINRLKKNVYLHLITVGDVDQAVYESIMKKQDFDLNIYAKTRTL